MQDVHPDAGETDHVLQCCRSEDEGFEDGDLDPIIITSLACILDLFVEWLRWWTWNPLASLHTGSSPANNVLITNQQSLLSPAVVPAKACDNNQCYWLNTDLLFD